MSKSTVMHIRVEPDVKINAEKTLSLLGLSTSDAINIFLRQIILLGGIPFEIKLPVYNEITQRAMKEALEISKSQGGFNTTEELFEDLND
ncbi:MAG: type II toxin-antitoxin system RelB/DinJ family antitoxin [Clostridiales bacterium]|nr:type II toxin-antitoxin system RelB/DinJ family antitoxin [Clostridiales bacterium]